MGKGVASKYINPVVTICGNCFHRDVCGDKDYLTENECCNHVIDDLGELARTQAEGRVDAKMMIGMVAQWDSICKKHMHKEGLMCEQCNDCPLHVSEEFGCQTAAKATRIAELKNIIKDIYEIAIETLATADPSDYHEALVEICNYTDKICEPSTNTF